MSVMRPQIRRSVLGLVLLSGMAGCTSGFHLVTPTPLDQAEEEVAESLLLDVGVQISEAEELSESQCRRQGTNPDIRKSECHYIPYHLKNTLQRSSHWGSVQVVPADLENVDLKIASQLLESNGEIMQLNVEVVDASGQLWLQRKYQANVEAEQYEDTVRGERDAVQDLYNTVANDLAAFKGTLSESEIERIRTISKLKFAVEFAPDAFDDYLVEDDQGRVTVQHLPADDDPLMERIGRIRERDYMFVDTLNQYYEGFYDNMWEAYQNWRGFNLVELEAKRQVEREAFLRILSGILMIAAAVALEVGDVSNADTARNVLVLAGGQVVVSGVNVSEQAKIHAAAIEELSESFGSDMSPTVLELEGKQYELTGSASEQYEQWKELLQRIYYEETGFDADSDLLEAAGPAPAEAPIGP